MRWDLVLARFALGGLAIITVVGISVLGGTSSGGLTRTRLGAAIVAVSLVWLLLNGSMEGPTILRISHGHGVTLADLGSVPALLVAAALVLT